LFGVEECGLGVVLGCYIDFVGDVGVDDEWVFVVYF